MPGVVCEGSSISTPHQSNHTPTTAISRPRSLGFRVAKIPAALAVLIETSCLRHSARPTPPTPYFSTTPCRFKATLHEKLLEALTLAATLAFACPICAGKEKRPGAFERMCVLCEHLLRSDLTSIIAENSGIPRLGIRHLTAEELLRPRSSSTRASS